jgi:cobalamin biosynthesis protein CobD/CbiB
MMCADLVEFVVDEVDACRHPAQHTRQIAARLDQGHTERPPLVLEGGHHIIVCIHIHIHIHIHIIYIHTHIHLLYVSGT